MDFIPKPGVEIEELDHAMPCECLDGIGLWALNYTFVQCGARAEYRVRKPSEELGRFHDLNVCRRHLARFTKGANND